jgi:glycosyltransferase involved in cell wall biosynthesis
LNVKTIVVSGINMTEGGIFTILDNCLQEMSLFANKNNCKIIALVNDASKFNYPNIEYIAFPKSKKSWFYRLYYEYYYFKKLSLKINPDVWLSLHDISPNVVAKKRFVYCHHPTVFYKSNFNDWWFDYKIGLFSIFYKYLYQINIKKNNAVFVQQNWIKDEFEKRFCINNVIVALPEFTEEITTQKISLDTTKIHFFYPSFPRTFKNFEIIFEALSLLDNSTINKIQFHFSTIKDNPKKYAQYLYNKYHNNKAINFMGWLSREELLSYYNSVDCIVFPSKLETWGLPLSEAKAYKKPILAANLPYAKETVGNYEQVSFFDIDNPNQLAQLITNFVNKTIDFEGNNYTFDKNIVLHDWNQLFDVLLKK